MAWVKVPTAATAVACTACVAAAMALPAADTAADRLAKAITANMHLSALDITSWDALSALPAYEALLSGDPSQLLSLDSLSGLPAYLDYLTTFNLEAFRTVDGGQAGLAALNALPLYEDLFSSDPTVQAGAFAGLDSISGIPSILALDPSGIAATDAIPHYQAFLTNGDTSVNGLGGVDAFSALPAFKLVPTQGIAAFVPSGGGSNPGYAALSGLNSYATGDLSGIDAFSALTPPVTMASQQAAAKKPAVVPDAVATTTGDTTGDATPASTRSGPIKKIIEKVKEDVGNLGKFSPTTTGNGTILLPTGGASTGEGMRGYGAVANKLRAAVGLGPDKSGDAGTG